MVIINENGYFCEFRSDVEGLNWNKANIPAWDKNTFKIGDKIMCEEDWSLWDAAINGTWKEIR